MYTGFQVKYLFHSSYFSENVIFSTILKNTQISTFMQGSPMGAEYSMWMARRTDGWTDGWTDGRMDGRADRHDEAKSHY